MFGFMCRQIGRGLSLGPHLHKIVTNRISKIVSRQYSKSTTAKKRALVQYNAITKKTAKDVQAFLLKHFLPDEPIAKSLGPPPKRFPEFEEMCKKIMDDSMSIVAQATNKEVGGCILNSLEKKSEQLQKLEAIKTIKNENFKKLKTLLSAYSLSFDIFKEYDVNEVVSIDMLCVHPKYSGQGIAKQLIRLTINRCKDCGFEVIRTDATGKFSQALFASCEFEVKAEAPYLTYTDRCGRPVFPVEAPHDSLQLMVLKL